MTSSATPFPPDQPEGKRDRWMHDLRNELAAALMAAAAMRRLLDAGLIDHALVNLQRLEDACERCRQLLPVT